jgi:hypothetical protein
MPCRHQYAAEHTHEGVQEPKRVGSSWNLATLTQKWQQIILLMKKTSKTTRYFVPHQILTQHQHTPHQNNKLSQTHRVQGQGWLQGWHQLLLHPEQLLGVASLLQHNKTQFKTNIRRVSEIRLQTYPADMSKVYTENRVAP